METRLYQFATNINGKLACDKMLHVDVAPSVPVTQKMMDETIVEIFTADGSMKPTKWLLARLDIMPLDALGSWVTWASHGMDMADYWKVAREKGFTGASVMGIYYYKKYTP